MNVTIKDIAKETGLSLATISKYLNNKKIQEKNRQLIESAIERLNYKPNRTAQTLRSKHTMSVAILVPDLGNYFWGAIISSITQYFIKYNYTVITCSYCHDREVEIDVIKDLIARNIDGLIMLPSGPADSNYHLLQKANIPVVILDQLLLSSDKYPVDSVTSDNYGGGAMIAEYLLKKGHKDVYILDDSENSYTVPLRIQGFRDVYTKAGIELPLLFDPISFTFSQDVMNQGRRRFRRVMNQPVPPTAIFFTNYLMGMGGLIEANTSSYAIPDDISLICFDDDRLFRSMYPPITAVSQNLSEMGETAARLLLRRIHGDFSDFPCLAVQPVEFHERQSVKDISEGSK
jgi:LacI family transcriptional regulator